MKLKSGPVGTRHDRDLHTRSVWKVALFFGALGPPIGGLLVLGASLLREPIWEAPLLVLIIAFYSYVFGLLPAMITGLAAATLSRRIESDLIWIGLATAFGWAIAAVFSILSDNLLDKLLDGYIGAIPALVCAAISCRWRPRRRLADGSQDFTPTRS